MDTIELLYSISIVLCWFAGFFCGTRFGLNKQRRRRTYENSQTLIATARASATRRWARQAVSRHRNADILDSEVIE